MSYRDLEIDFKSILEPQSVSNFLIHCPELFSEDHILDLSSRNDDYRNRSIAELNKVIDLTRNMKEYFGLKNDIRIIVNVGGFSKNQFLDSNTKSILYGILGNSLDQIDTLACNYFHKQCLHSLGTLAVKVFTTYLYFTKR